MNILQNRVDGISVDSFVSSSGLFTCKLVASYVPTTTIAGVGTLKRFDMVALNAKGQVHKVVTMGTDADLQNAMENWEAIKMLFTAKREEPEEKPDEWTTEKSPFHNCVITQKELDLLKIEPMGAKVFVREITPIDAVTASAEKAGLFVVVAPENMPRATMGLVIAVGNDPFIQGLVRVGDVVMFRHHSGSTFMEEGQQYRQLLDSEIDGVRRKENGYADLGLTGEDLNLIEPEVTK